MTLKLHRLERDGCLDDAQREYFQRLLTPYTKTIPPAIGCKEILNTTSVTVEPKIIAHSYFVRISYRIEGPAAENPATLQQHVRVRYCEHTNGFGSSVEHAIIDKHEEKEAYCSYCKSDFSVIVGEDWAEVKIWHDLGDEASLVETAWPAFPGFGYNLRRLMSDPNGGPMFIWRVRERTFPVARRVFEAGHDYLEHCLEGSWMDD